MSTEETELNIASNKETIQVHPQDAGSPSNCSMDSFFRDIFDDFDTCTHTHTCNPPGPDLSHSHTCLHVHTKFLPAAHGATESPDRSSSKRCHFGNKEAVRKSRQKKKARLASLEDENRELRSKNQQLMKTLQGLAFLKAENARLKCLLVDLRGRIDGEIGSFPYDRTTKGERLDGF